MGRRLRHLKTFYGWLNKHSVAVDAFVILWLGGVLAVNLNGYVNSGWPWGGLAILSLAGAILLRVWTLAWSRGYTRATRNYQSLLDRQTKLLEAQSEAIKHTMPMPVILLDKDKQEITMRMFISPN
jgi:hypothetical protein